MQQIPVREIKKVPLDDRRSVQQRGIEEVEESTRVFRVFGGRKKIMEQWSGARVLIISNVTRSASDKERWPLMSPRVSSRKGVGEVSNQ